MEYSDTAVKRSRFLQGSEIEIIRDSRPASPPEHVMFDFDGTISLIREGWQRIMSELIVELLRGTGTRLSRKDHDVTLSFEHLAQPHGLHPSLSVETLRNKRNKVITLDPPGKADNRIALFVKTRDHRIQGSLRCRSDDNQVDSLGHQVLDVADLFIRPILGICYEMLLDHVAITLTSRLKLPLRDHPVRI